MLRAMIAAVVQMTSGAELARNLARAGELIAHAAGLGAELVALPENFALMRGESAPGPNPHAQDVPNGEVMRFLRGQATAHGIALAGGTFPERIAGDPRVFNTSVVIDRGGALLALYRKIHLFDVDLPGGRENYRESENVVPGAQPVTVDTPAGRLGLSVCYDLRFPELYRKLVSEGAEILSVPSAFTGPTGRAHWEILLRARAVENLSFVIAAAQTGIHDNDRETYGDSLVVDWWGRVLARQPRGTGVVTAALDREGQRAARRGFPALDHRRID